MSQTDQNGHPSAPVSTAEGNHKGEPSAGGPARTSWLSPRNLGIAGVLTLLFLTMGVRHFIIVSHYESTDDAYLSADVVQIAPQVSGVVKEVLVKDNQEVKAGDLLVVLDDAQYKASVAQKKADLDAAIAQARGAGVNVELISEQGKAQMMQAQGGVEQAASGITGARADVERSLSAVRNAEAVAKSVGANVGAAGSSVDAAIANKKRYAEAVSAALAQLDAAKAAVATAQANVEAAKALSDRAARDAERYASLSSQGAASRQKQDEATAGAAAAKAQLESAQAQVASARAVVMQKQADLSAAKQQLESSDAAIAQARSQLAASHEQYSAAVEGVHQAEAQSHVILQAVSQARAKKDQALGQLEQARTVSRQVKVGMSAQEQAKAKIEQAKAALQVAELQLGYTRIYAPVSGRISKKSVQVGALVQSGTPLMAAVVKGVPWVAANFKETQLAGVRPGCPAEVRVDALPGRMFKARVESLSPATGSTFALLPPDNATGNFTKVVQRLPVKIMLLPGQPDIDHLGAGMSVVAKVKRG